MKRIIPIFLASLLTAICYCVWAQETIPLPQSVQDTIPLPVLKSSAYCGNGRYPLRSYLADTMEIIPRRSLALPEVLGVYIHVVKNDAGTSPGTSMDSVMLKFELMRDFYAPHGICFLLAGVGEIHSTDLDTQYYDTEEGELAPYLKPDLLNIFIHDYLAESPGGPEAGGWAYAIPNPYFSWWELSVIDTNAMSVVAHETGHCLGLYHTHEDFGGSAEENVDRTGPCKDCDTDGDKLCDTPADPNMSGFMSGCTYIGFFTDNCGDLYAPDPTNVMSYSPGSCHTNLTGGQGSRMLDKIYNVSFLNDMILPLNIVFPSNLSFLYDSDEWFWLAEGYMHMESPSLICSESAEVTFAAGDEVTIGPGTTFAPTTGFVSVNVQDLCD